MVTALTRGPSHKEKGWSLVKYKQVGERNLEEHHTATVIAHTDAAEILSKEKSYVYVRPQSLIVTVCAVSRPLSLGKV